MNKIDRIFETISNLHGGSVFSISYRSELPLKSKYKKQGMTIYKVVTKLARTGVEYTHISGVIPSENNKPYYAEAVVRNRIYKNVNNGTLYVRLARWGNPHSKVSYVLQQDESSELKFIDKLDLEEYVIPSYWNKSKEIPAVTNVKFENILAIGDVICG